MRALFSSICAALMCMLFAFGGWLRLGTCLVDVWLMPTMGWSLVGTLTATALFYSVVFIIVFSVLYFTSSDDEFA